MENNKDDCLCHSRKTRYLFHESLNLLRKIVSDRNGDLCLFHGVRGYVCVCKNVESEDSDYKKLLSTLVNRGILSERLQTILSTFSAMKLSHTAEKGLAKYFKFITNILNSKAEDRRLTARMADLKLESGGQSCTLPPKHYYMPADAVEFTVEFPDLYFPFLIGTKGSRVKILEATYDSHIWFSRSSAPRDKPVMVVQTWGMTENNLENFKVNLKDITKAIKEKRMAHYRKTVEHRKWLGERAKRLVWDVKMERRKDWHKRRRNVRCGQPNSYNKKREPCLIHTKCRNCGLVYNVSGLQNNECIYHEGFYSDNFWTCCEQKEDESPGCKKGRHLFKQTKRSKGQRRSEEKIQSKEITFHTFVNEN